jgi:transposase
MRPCAPWCGRESGESYAAYVKQLAAAAGLKNPTPEQLARFDRKRKKTMSNREWTHPVDPSARVAKMKDGRAHKAEHAVDLESGAVVAVTLQGADQGDTSTIQQTLPAAQRTVQGACGRTIEEMATDKGYHSDEVLREAEEQKVRSYVAEPERERRRWKGRGKEAEQRRLYANRRRQRGAKAKRLQSKRGELAERSFAHVYDTGGMRRVHLRGRKNILKRLLVQVAGFNLSLLMRKKHGVGKPRRLQGQNGPWVCPESSFLQPVWHVFAYLYQFCRSMAPIPAPSPRFALSNRAA